MNLQEQIGPYLVLRQLSQHERYQMLLAAKESTKKDQHSLSDALDLIELLSSLRGETDPKNPTSFSDLDPLMVDSANRLLGWSPADSISTGSGQEPPFTPWMQRPWSEGVSLQELIKGLQISMMI